MVQEWANGADAPAGQGYANDGLIIKDENEGETQDMLSVQSPTASSDQPYLEIFYEARGFGENSLYTQLPATQLSEELSLSINPASGNVLLITGNGK